MVQLKENISHIKDSNLVFLIEENADLIALNSLKLDIKIISKIEETIKKGENKKLSFFLGGDDFEKLFVLYYSKNSKNTILEFLGEQFPKLSSKLTLLSNNDQNLIDLVDSCLLSRYKFEKYKTEKKVDEIYVIVSKENEINVKNRLETIENIILARDLGETPACDLTPENFVNIVKMYKFSNTKIKILTPRDIEKKGLGLIHGVGKGSINKPYMVILERIVDKKLPTYGFVGKGIVFDTGGLDIKPSDSMYGMKDDMCGAGSVFCTMKELDKKDLNVNIIACLCLAENSVSGESYRPSDILTSYSGKTVNITNTDAEGRLVLADGVAYISKNYNIDSIITIATLTGVAMHALGFRYAGVMGTDRFIIDRILENSKTDFEKYCELPFDNYYVEKCKGDIADLDNWTKGVFTGASMGAGFIYNFILNKEKFTHLDIAGVANNSYESYGLFAKGTTGFGVDSLSKLFLSL